MPKKSLVNLEGLGYTGLPLPTLPTDAASKAYVDAQNHSGGGGSSLLPFWDSSNTKDCITLSNGVLPFWDSTNTQDDITLGC